MTRRSTQTFYNIIILLFFFLNVRFFFFGVDCFPLFFYFWVALGAKKKLKKKKNLRSKISGSVMRVLVMCVCTPYFFFKSLVHQIYKKKKNSLIRFFCFVLGLLLFLFVCVCMCVTMNGAKSVFWNLRFFSPQCCGGEAFGTLL